MARILVLFDSRGGLTEQLAEAIGAGVRDVPGADLALRRVHESEPSELLTCDALILGSPNWSGITGKLKDWFDYSGDLWETGELAGKPGGALIVRVRMPERAMYTAPGVAPVTRFRLTGPGRTGAAPPNTWRACGRVVSQL